jgi:hypothetical protein
MGDLRRWGAQSAGAESDLEGGVPGGASRKENNGGQVV